MLEKITYPNINAKLKGMYAKTLSQEDLEDLLKQKTIKDAIIILKSKLKPLEDLKIDATRIELESELDNLIISDIEKIYKHLDNKTKKIFDSYILKYKMKILRIIWKELVVGRQFERENELANWMKCFKELDGIENIQTQEEFLEKIKDKKLKKIFGENENLFDLESLLTKYYYENLYLEAKGTSTKLKDIISEQIDIINISSIYRCKKYYGFYKGKYFINYGKILKKEDIQEIENVESLQEIKELLKNTKYREIIETSIEENSKKYMHKKLKKYFKEEQFDIISIIAYFYIKEVEQANIVTIIEGIRYKLTPEEIRKQLS